MHLYYAGKGLQWLAQRMGFEAGSTGMSTVFTLGLILGCMIIPYLLGNFNTAIILGKALRHEDIRQFGSGNAGTTNVLRTYGKGIYIGYAFKRIWEGGHGTASQHYAGVAFDVGQGTGSAIRQRIHAAATATRVWGYVEPLSMTPTWVHFDRRYGNPACSGTTAGYPTVRRGSKNTYVLILQDALNALGYSTKTLDGAFGKNTYDALRAAQRSFNLTADGVCGCNTWKKLTSAVVGIGRTKTVID